MSGGVDSSVAAALLKRAGFSVSGVFMKFWSEGKKAENRCCSSESEKRARQVAVKLNIPFYVFNFEKEFKKKIVDCFLRDYGAGLTPNPCVVCNKEIKFGLLLEKTLAFGADFIATGHYARVSPSSEKFSLGDTLAFKLFRAKDKEKDQSYFLWELNQKQLSRVLFPVGNYTKPEVRKMAERFGLPTFATPDSQEVCFVPGAVNDFLAKYIKQKPGNIVDARGNVLGRHDGLAFYTIGQRKGIGLAGGPYWVAAKDLRKNRLIVAKDEKDLLKKELTFKNVNWISGEPPKFPVKVRVKIRYRANLAPAKLFKNKLVFGKSQRAITPGQSVVFYLPAEARRAEEGRGSQLLGGGIIMF